MVERVGFKLEILFHFESFWISSKIARIFGNLENKTPLDMLGTSVFAYESFYNHLENFLDWCCILDFGRFGYPVGLSKLAVHPVWTRAVELVIASSIPGEQRTAPLPLRCHFPRSGLWTSIVPEVHVLSLGWEGFIHQGCDKSSRRVVGNKISDFRQNVPYTKMLAVLGGAQHRYA